MRKTFNGLDTLTIDSPLSHCERVPLLVLDEPLETPEQQYIRELTAENKRLRTENKTLKKAGTDVDALNGQVAQLQSLLERKDSFFQTLLKSFNDEKQAYLTKIAGLEDKLVAVVEKSQARAAVLKKLGAEDPAGNSPTSPRFPYSHSATESNGSNGSPTKRRTPVRPEGSPVSGLKARFPQV